MSCVTGALALVGYASYCGHRPELLSRRPAIVETALQFPVSQIKLPLSATIQARSIGPAFAGKRPAEPHVPATKHARH
jgi:hypothetical protein